VFSNVTLHWIKDHKRLLKNVYRSLKANGILRLTLGLKEIALISSGYPGAMQLSEYAAYFSGFEQPWYFPGIGAIRKVGQGLSVSRNESVG